MPPRMAPSAVASLPDSSQRWAVIGLGGARCLSKLEAGGGVEADLDGGPAGLDGGRPLVGQPFLDRHEQLLGGKAEQAGGDAERDHVGAPVRDGLGQLLHGNFDDAGAGLADDRRRLAAARIADHK